MRRGNTLIEVAVTLVVIAIVSAIVVTVGRLDSGAADDTQARTSLTQALASVEDYRAAHDGDLAGMTLPDVPVVDITLVSDDTAATSVTEVSLNATTTVVTAATTAQSGCWYARYDYAATTTPLLIASAATGTCSADAAEAALAPIAADWETGDPGTTYTDPIRLP